MSRSHPVLLIALILTQTIIICVTAWVKIKISWFSYILFLIFLGGLMVLFVYITSLASNELIVIDFNTYLWGILTNMLFILFLYFNLNEQTKLNEAASFFKTFNFIYSWNSVRLTTLTIIYLLLTLIIVVKISNKFEGPIKNLIFK